MVLANKKYVVDKWYIPGTTYYYVNADVKNNFTYSLSISNKKFVIVELISPRSGYHYSFAMRENGIGKDITGSECYDENNDRNFQLNISTTEDTISWKYAVISSGWRQKIWAWGYAFKEPTDLIFGRYNWNSFANQNRWFPIANSFFYDDYELIPKYYESYKNDNSKITMIYDEVNKVHSFIPTVDFTGQTRATFDKTDDNGNGLLLKYNIWEDGVIIDEVNSGSTNIAFDRVKTVNFKAGSVYEFTYFGTPTEGGGFFINNFSFYIKEI